MISPVHEAVVEVSTEAFTKMNLDFLEEAFPNLDIYSKCSSFDPTDTMAEKGKPFFKDGINDKFTEAVSTQNILLYKFNFCND